jgi:hypothetical protein
MRMANNFTSMSEAAESALRRNAIPLSAAAAAAAAAADVVVLLPAALWVGRCHCGSRSGGPLLASELVNRQALGLATTPKELLVSRNRETSYVQRVVSRKQDATGRWSIA